MKLSLQEKIDADMPLNIGELCKATDYSRRKMKQINPPMVAGKCRLSNFKQHEQSIQAPRYATALPASVESVSRPQSALDKLREQQQSHDRQVASRHPEVSPALSCALRTLLSDNGT